MKELELEIRGRQMVAETIAIVMLAHVAAGTNDPALFIGQIVNDVADNLGRAEQQTKDRNEKREHYYAEAIFSKFSEALQAHLREIVSPTAAGKMPCAL
jgi:hypothetical protein